MFVQKSFARVLIFIDFGLPFACRGVVTNLFCFQAAVFCGGFLLIRQLLFVFS